MFYNLPPSPPAIVYVEPAVAPGDEQIASDCKRGSRDCFPEDRVGYQASETWDMALVPLSIDPTQDV